MTDSIKSLFDPVVRKSEPAPLAHRADPLSSFQAGDRALKSGKIKGQVRLCLLGVRRWPGRTSAELAVLLGISRYDTARRLPLLMNRGLVVKGPSRLCTACRTVCVTWTTPGREKYPLLNRTGDLMSNG